MPLDQRSGIQTENELADSLPQIVFETDVVGKITFGNRRGLEVLQYTQEDLARGVNALDIFIPEDQERIQKNIIRILKGEILPDVELGLGNLNVYMPEFEEALLFASSDKTTCAAPRSPRSSMW